MDSAVEKTPEAGADLQLAPAVRQEQVLAPQLRECLRVLQMDLPTLANEVRHEAEVNPVIEIDSPDDMTLVSEELRTEAQLDESTGEPPLEDEPIPSMGVDEEAAERRQRFFDRQVAAVSLQEHLLAQVGAAGFDADGRELAELIIGDIDDDGRYVGSFAELVSVMGVTNERLEEVLGRIQSFDPPGVGARNLRECLSIQARQLDVAPPQSLLVQKIIAEHLGRVARKELPEIARSLGVSEEDCEEAVRVLRTLEPKPGRPFLANGRHPQFIRPELDVEMTPQGITLSSTEHELPTLRINSLYRDMAADDQTPKETRKYLRSRIGAAELLQDAIRRRGETILRVAEEVFSEQYDFFERGFEALRPLTIEEIAHRTGFHGTTVGRAVRGKYVRTPRGIFELRRFFCVGHLGKSGAESVSAVAVKCRLASLINSDEGVSLTDDELARELGKDGLSISRRTVSKYRAELDIPSVAERIRKRNFP